MTPTADRTGSDVLWDGFIAGALGAVALALWFLVLDLAAGHPLYTPTVLGEAFFAGTEAALAVEHGQQGTVVAYSGVHLAAFVAFGTAVAWLVARFRGERFAVPLLAAVFALFEVAAYLMLLIAAPPVAETLGAWPVLVGNLLAAAVMAGYFVLRFPGLLGRRGPGRD